MLCEKCKKNTATSIFKQTINGKSTTMHLCSECASSMMYTNVFSDFGIKNFFSGGLSQHHDIGKTCEKCNTTLSEITKGIIGCDECYNVFADELLGTIEQIHGKSAHVGKRPKSIKGSSISYVEDKEETKDSEKTLDDKIKENKELLKKLIKNEEFEKAAEIRDKIKELENGGQQND